MGKNILLGILVTMLGIVVDADEVRVYGPIEARVRSIAGEPPQDLPPLSEWSAFQLAIAPGFPPATNNSNVNGLKLGLLASGGKGRVWGTEISVFSSSTDNVKGFQASILANVANFFEGVQAGLVNVVKVGGDLPFQFGLVNYAEETGVQFGLVNILPDSSLPFFPVFNMNAAPSKATYIQTKPNR